MKKYMLKVLMTLAILLGCFTKPSMVAVAAQRGWVKNENGAWTYVNKNGERANGYCKYNEGDKRYYFFWCPGFIDEDGNSHETYTLAWDKIIIKESTGEPLYVASKEGPLLENYELIYNGCTYRSDSSAVLRKIGDEPDGELWIENETHPSSIQAGRFFPIKGKICSDGNIQSVLAEIVDNDENQMHAAFITMNQSEYDLSREVDEAMVFNDLAPGIYIYRVKAKDSCGNEDWLIWDEFEVVPSQQQTSYGDVSAVYQHQETNKDCTVTSVLMMLRSKAMKEGNDWGRLTLSGLKSMYWGSSGMAWRGSYGGYSFTSDNASIKNNNIGSGVSQIRYDNLVSALSSHPEGVVLYLYDAANYNKSHAVFVTRIQNGVIYCLDPYGPSSEIPLANSPTFNSNFGLYDQQSILSLNNTSDGRSFLWYCN